jgi:hypothetical protein
MFVDTSTNTSEPLQCRAQHVVCNHMRNRIAELEAALRTIATMSVQDVGSGLDWSAGRALMQIEKTARAAWSA